MAAVCGGFGLSAEDSQAFDPAATLEAYLAPEAPKAVFDIGVGDSRVELFFDGGWKTGLGGYVAFNSAGSADTAVTMPGFAQRPWYNLVDFAVSLWIDRSFFADIRLDESIRYEWGQQSLPLEPGSFALGWYGGTATGLNLVRIGNSAIEADGLEAVGLGGGRTGQPGAVVEWTGPSSRHAGMLRVANLASQLDEFRGTAPEGVHRVSPRSWQEGQFFRLPYDRLATLEVMLEDASGILAGDGRRYRPAMASDLAFIDRKTGRFGLAAPASGRVLARLSITADSQAMSVPALDRTDGLAASDTVPFDSTSFAARVLAPLKSRYLVGDGSSTSGLQVAVGSERWWLVYDPGRFSLFQDLGWYRMPEGFSPERVSGFSSTGTEVPVGIAGRWARPITSTSDSIVDRYPLLSAESSGVSDMYLPDALRTPKADVVWRGAGQSSDILRLSQDPVPGTIAVTRNGVADVAFEWLADRKGIRLLVPPAPGDRIEVRYQTARPAAGSERLQIAQSNQFKLAPGADLAVATGLDWGLPAADGHGDGARLAAAASLGIKPQEGGIGLSAALNAAADLPGDGSDRTLVDLAAGSFGIEPAESALLPSYPNSWMNATGHTESSRGDLLWRDSRAGSGAYLSWTASLPEPVAIAAGQATGPYLATAETAAPFAGRVYVAEYRMPNGRDWVSWEIRLTPEQAGTLVDATEISFWVRSDSDTGIRLWHEAGKLDEDFDGTGLLRSGIVGSSGILFRHQADGIDLVAAVGHRNASGALLAKDRNGNGRLDPGLPSAPAPSDANEANRYADTRAWIDLETGDTGWRQVRVVITPADRVRLAGADGIRFTVSSPTTAGDRTGRVVVGGLRIGTAQAKPRLSGSIGSASVTIGRDADAARGLSSAFPGARALPETGEIERMDWTGGPGRAVAERLVDPFGYGRNRLLSTWFQIAQPLGTGGSLVLMTSDGNGNGFEARLDASSLVSGVWYRAELDFAAGTLSAFAADGSRVAKAAAAVTGSPQRADRIAAGIDAVGPGTIRFGNWRLGGAQAGFRGSASVGFEWQSTGPIWSPGGFPLIGAAAFSQKLDGSLASDGAGIAGAPATPSVGAVWSGTGSVAVAGLGVGFRQRISLQPEGIAGSAGYDLEFPRGVSLPFRLGDSWTTGIGLSDWPVSKSSKAGFDIPGVAAVDASVAARHDGSTLAREWNGSLSLLPGSALNSTGSFRLTQEGTRTDEVSAWSGMSIDSRLSKAFEWYAPDGLTGPVADSSAWSLRTQLAAAPIDLSVSQSFMAEAQSGAPVPFKARLDLDHLLSLKDKAGDWMAELRYRRRGAVEAAAGATDAGGFLERMALTATTMPEAWAVVPVAELFTGPVAFSASSAVWSGAEVQPAVSLGLQRPVSIDPVIQLLPKRIDVGLGRTLRTTGSLLSDRLAVDLALTGQALNLAGRNAALVVFPWYATDQSLASLRSAWSWGEGLATTWQGQADVEIELSGLGVGTTPQIRKPLPYRDDMPAPERLKLAAGCFLRIGEAPVMAAQGVVSFSWSADLPPLQFPEGFPQPESPPYVVNAEELSGEGSDSVLAPPVSTGLFSPRGFSHGEGWYASLRHRSALILPGLGHLSLTFSYGLQQKNVSGGIIHAFQGSIEARLLL